MNKYLVGASAAVISAFGLAQTAGAADLPVEIPVVEPVPVAPLWSGFYVGGQIGYAFGADVIGRNPKINDLDRRLDDRGGETPDCYLGGDDTDRDRLAEFLETVSLSEDSANVRIGDGGEAVLRDPLDLGTVLVPFPPFGSFPFPVTVTEEELDEACVAAFLSDRDDARAVLGPYRIEKNDDESWEAGIYVGADAQFGNFVLGVIGDINWIDLEGDVLVRNAGGTEVFRANADLDWYATLRARAGFAFDRFLAYAHGGLAYSRIEIEGVGRNVEFVSGTEICFEEARDVVPIPLVYGSNGNGQTPPRLICFDDVDPTLQPVAFNADEDLWGYAIGVGAEALIRENVSAKLEYQYTNLGEESFGGLFDETESAEVEVDFHTVRLGVAFRF